MAVNYKVEVDTKDAEKKLNDLSTKFEDAFNAGRAFDGTNARLKKLINDTSTYVRQLKKEFQDTAAALEAKGVDTKSNKYLQQLSRDIKTAESELEGLRENMKARRMESENMFQGMAQGASALMGAFTAVQGAAALFGAEEEKLAKIQTKLQASMSILMGLQRAGNLLNSQSQFRIQVVNKLMEAWHRMNLKVAASEGVKKAAMLGVIGVIGALIAGITALIIKYSKYADEVKRAKDLQKEFKQGFANSAATEISELTRLQALWKATNGDIEKQNKLISQEKSSFEQLGITETNIKKVEDQLFSSEVRENIMKKAKAAAYLAQVNSIVAKQMELQAKIENEKNRPKTWWESFALTDYAVQEKKDKAIQEYQDEIDRYEGELQTALANYENEVAGVTNATLDKKYANDFAARRNAAIKGYESLLRLEQNRENALADAKIAAIQNESERELATLEQSHKKRLQQIENDKKDYIEKLRDQAKLEYSAANPNGDAEAYARNWKPSAETEKKVNEYYDELARIETESYKRSQQDLYAKLQESKWQYWQEYGSVTSKEKAIIENYEHQIRKAVDNNDNWKAMSLTAKRDEELWKVRNESRFEYLEKYGTYREKELAITEKYDHLIENEVDEFNRRLLKAQKEQELLKLKQSSAGNIVFWDEKQLSRNTLKKALAEAEKELSRLRMSGRATNEEINVLLQRVQAIRGELENTRFMANGMDAQGFIEGLLKLKNLQEELDKNWENMEKANLDANSQAFEEYSALVEQGKEAIEKQKEALKSGLVGIGAQLLASSLTEAANQMQKIADLADDTHFKDFADQFSAVAQNFAAAGQGAATGGWIGAVVAGGSDLIGQTVQAIGEGASLELRATKNAEDWARALKNVNVEMQEVAYNSPFGERNIAKGREAMRSSIEAIRRYGEELADLNKKYSEQQIETFTYGGINSVGANIFLNPLGWLSGKSEFSKEWLAYQSAINKGYEGLQKMLVKTKDRSGWANLWGAQDEYMALGDLYPELFKDGELVVDQAKKLLETNNALSDSQKEQIKNLVELKEKYDEAIKTIDDIIASTFSNLSSDISDIIWDSVMNGTDAWSEFEKVGSETISALGKQLIQEMVISSYLDNFREDMRNAYMLGSPEDTQTRLREIVGNIFGGLQDVFEAGTAAAREWQEWATDNGFDLTEAKERTAASKAISGVSQETFNEMSGRVTSIQLSAYSIDETTQAIRDRQAEMAGQMADILLVLNGIHGDTGGIREAVAALREDMTIIKSNLGTMADKGVRMLN